MHTRVVMMRFFAVAGMVLDLFPNLRREIVLTCRRSTACFAAAARRPAAFVFRNLLQYILDIGGGPRIRSLVKC